MDHVERLLATTGGQDGDGTSRSDRVDAGPRPDPPEQPRDTPDELGMTAEVYLHQLLAQRDGRARQDHLLEATGWSRGTIDRLLSGMEEVDAVVRRRIGPRTVVYLPETVDETCDAP